MFGLFKKKHTYHECTDMLEYVGFGLTSRGQTLVQEVLNEGLSVEEATLSIMLIVLAQDMKATMVDTGVNILELKDKQKELSEYISGKIQLHQLYGDIQPGSALTVLYATLNLLITPDYKQTDTVEIMNKTNADPVFFHIKQE